MKKIFIALLCAFALTASAQKKISTYEVVKNNTPIPYKRYIGDPTNARFYTLENGLTVILAVNKDQPRVQTLIATKAGSKNDPADNTGLAHYLEHMLFKGTDKYGSLDWEKEKVFLAEIDRLYEVYNKTKDTTRRKLIYKQIDSVSTLAAQYAIANEYDKMTQAMGAQGTNAFTSFEETVYINDIPSNQLHRWIKLEAERFRNPILRLFHTELEAVYEEKNRSLDNDRNKVFEALFAGLFKNHPYGTQTTIGTVEHLKNPSLIKIREYYNTYYVPNNMAIIMAGDFNPDEVIKMINNHFGYMKPGKLPEFKFKPEYPKTKPEVIEIVGPDAENLTIGYRMPGAGTKEAVMLELIDLILNNSKAGLIDLNLVKKQKVLSANSGFYNLKDYGVFLFTGNAKTGQSLEEVKSLLLEQLELIKNGKFDESILKAIIANKKVEEIEELESNSGIAYKLMYAFVQEENWMNVLNKTYDISKITKQEIIDFAKEYFTDDYVVIYKRTGESTEIEKIEKPQITKVEVNRDKTSPFATSILEEETEPVAPVFLDFSKDIEREKIASGKAELYYIKNNKNQLFTLYYVLDMGRFHDKKLPLALNYLQYLGTDKYSADEISKKFYELACNFGISAGNKRSYVYLSGLQENFTEALQLFEHLLANAKADDQALKDLIDRQLKQRENNKKSKSAIQQALSSYLLYGTDNPYKWQLTNDELNKLKSAELVTIIKNLTSYQHTVFYHGPESKNNIAANVSQNHKLPVAFIPTPKEKVFEYRTLSKNEVFFVDYKMVQAELLWRSPLSVYNPAEAPTIQMFNEYFGGGMSSIVFQEIREARALAYSTYAYFSTPSERGKQNVFIAYVGTQADKMHEGFAAMNELLQKMPQDEGTLNLAKESIKNNIENERILNTDIFFTYLNALDLGETNDSRQAVYAQIDSISLDGLVQFHNKYIKPATIAYGVLAGKDKITISSLSQYGIVKELSLEEIFGY